MPKGSSAALAAIYIVAYVALDWVSYLHPVAPFAITPWNPPPGLTIALLTIAGLRFWPAVVVAVLAAEVLVRGGGVHPVSSVIASVVFAAGYIAVSGFLLRTLRFDARLRRLRDVILLIGAAVNGTILVAAAYVGILVAAGALPMASGLSSAIQLWVGDAIGIIVTAPLAMLLVRGPLFDGPIGRWQSAEAALQVATVVGALAAVFVVGAEDEAKYFYLLFLPLVWVSLRHGLPGAILCLLFTQIGLVVGFRLVGHPPASVLDLQLLMLAIAITGLLLGGAVSDRRLAIDVLRDTELALERTMRAAAAAELASGLAHELNQPLAAASNYVRASRLMAADPGAHGPRLIEAMDSAVSEMRRASDVVRRLREFFRSGAVELRQTSVHDLVEVGARAWHERARRNGVDLLIDIPRDLPRVFADPTQIGIVLHNLVTNALDAVEATGPGTVVVTAAVEPGSAVRVTVADSGPGLSTAVSHGLFRPFSTTKADGLGLGLAISRSIVEQHGGRLFADEQVAGEGARFHLVLPSGNLA